MELQDKCSYRGGRISWGGAGHPDECVLRENSGEGEGESKRRGKRVQGSIERKTHWVMSQKRAR